MRSGESLQELLVKSIEMMNAMGFRLSGIIEVTVDESLPFMGYTTRTLNKNLIVVSGMAVTSGLLDGLLLHELSHIYRTESRHPSHKHGILNEVLRYFVSKHNIKEEYQLGTLRGIINHVQDLYADDVAFKVFEKNQQKLFPLQKIGEFFYNWIKTAAANSPDKIRNRWTNAAAMLNNAFALSNMKRHNVNDIRTKAAEANQNFLDKLSPQLSREFPYFENFMVNLEENVADEEFREQLEEYLRHFLALTV